MTRFYGEGAWVDHDRGAEVWGAKHVHLPMDDDQYDELIGDAEFYSDGCGGGLYPMKDYLGLISSAKATVRWLTNQGRPE